MYSKRFIESAQTLRKKLLPKKIVPELLYATMEVPSFWLDSWNNPRIFPFITPFLQCLIYYALVLVVHVGIFKLNSIFTPIWLRPILSDFFCTITSCTISFQHGILRFYYGSATYVLMSGFMAFLFRNIFKDSAPSVPANVLKYMKEVISFSDLLLRVSTQIFAIPAIALAVHLIWLLEIMPEHTQQLSQRTCASDLNVAVAMGFLIEGGAIALETWLSQSRITIYDSVDSCLKLFTGPIMVVLGIHHTGMYMNPTLASVMKFGCKGTTPWQHVLVYWLAPILGCILGVKIFNYHQKMLASSIVDVSWTDSMRSENGDKFKRFPRRKLKGRSTTRKR
ncbi:aquaporin-11 [Octopus bimaculoides]|uniref:Aquaporin n=1 Tax=Octopus bimaculoides TaxID=37653 RepID=A0A0L8GL31_OCTBM|nr:aquaporin-11 [Octopus bimaculoides]|eukprot:XP_014780010.1 PREDICTED: aquaporin-12A-like [Octopus bimaculoides]